MFKIIYSNIHQLDINVEVMDDDDNSMFTSVRDPFRRFKFDASVDYNDSDLLNLWSQLDQNDLDGDEDDNVDDTESLGDEDTDEDEFGFNIDDDTNGFVASKRKNMAALHDNEALGFASIVVNFKKHKKLASKS